MNNTATIKRFKAMIPKGYTKSMPKLKPHLTHKLEIAEYGNKVNHALECMDCCEVIYDFDGDVKMYPSDPTRVYTRDGKEYGIVVGERESFCKGCQEDHIRLAVRWKDGTLTYPCSKGLRTHPRRHNDMQIW